MTGMTLFELAGDYRIAAEKLSNLDLDEQTIADTLESLSGDLEAKATATAAVVRNLSSFAAQIKEAEDSMAERRKAVEKRAAALHNYLLENMRHTGILKIESPQFALTIKNNPPAIIIDEPGLIPAAYMTTPVAPPPAPDKAAIKAAIKAGAEVPGARMAQSVRLEIK